jgi:hypothetical protein
MMDEHDHNEDPASNGWHVDRRIPVAFIATVIAGALLQAFGLGMWAASNTSRITGLEESYKARTVYIGEIVKEQQETNTRLTRIEEQVGYIRQDLRKGGSAARP